MRRPKRTLAKAVRSREDRINIAVATAAGLLVMLVAYIAIISLAVSGVSVGATATSMAPSGNASIIDDPSASSGKALIFRAPVATTPSPSPTPAPTPAPAPSPAPTPAPAPAPTVPLAGYNKLIFDEEFNGSTLDTSKWQTCNPAFVAGGNVREAGDQYCKTHYNNEKQLFRMSTSPNTNNPNIKINGGNLHLIGTKENGQYYSGMISTGPNIEGYNLPNYKPFGYTYGYFEGRAKFPKGKGFWPSFWMRPTDVNGNGGWPYNGEYDIVEVLGGSPAYGGSTTNKIFQTRFDDETGSGGDDTNYIVADTSLDFHTYGFEWGPGFLQWYFDGKPYKRVNSSHIKNYPFYITANFSMCGDFSGPCDGSTPFPSEFTVDYMRVFQK